MAPKTIAAARKALAIDNTLAEAHTAMASASQDLWDWAGAEREYKRALELNPNEGKARMWYGLYLSAVGRHEEALAQYKRALEADPLNLTYNTNLAAGYGNMRKYDLALDQFKKTIDIDPNYASAHDNLGQTYRDMGKYDLWLEEWKKAATLADDQEDFAVANEAARAYAKGGFRVAISRIVELRKQLAQRRYVDSGFIAYGYAALGDKAQAFYWLGKAYSEKSGALVNIKNIKEMDALPL